jgi:hypothetical protein
MNTPAPVATPVPLNTQAIMIGSAVGIGASLAMAVFWSVVPMQNLGEWIGVALIVSQIVGASIDIATGAVAGWIARSRGSMHGLFAGLIANIVSLGIGYGMTLLRTDYGRTSEEVIQYLMALLPWQVIGIALSTIAGAIAVRLAARRNVTAV